MNVDWKHLSRFRLLFLAALILFPAAVWCGAAEQPVDSQSASSVQEATVPPAPPQQDTPARDHVHIADTVAGERELEAFTRQLTNGLEAWGKQSAKISAGQNTVWWIGGCLLFGTVMLTRFIPRFLALRNVHEDARISASVAAAYISPGTVAEEKAFSDFASNFRTGPSGTRRDPGPATETPAQPLPAESEGRRCAPKNDPLKDFFSSAPKFVACLRDSLKAIARATDSSARQELMLELACQTAALKTAAELPQLLPAWQMASALEALLNQLSAKPQNVTPSTLRTVTGAVDLINTLVRPGIKSDLAENPPIRVLAVDDDPLSRHAVAFALKKALNLPDLAANGSAALELAKQKTYDAVFLDVQMPGMDGFELCTKIHETKMNQAVPVVFITCDSDFNARARSSLAGGHDLIGKPFLTFEVALKALTLVLQHRLKQDAPEKPAPQEAPAPEPEPAPEALAAVS